MMPYVHVEETTEEIRAKLKMKGTPGRSLAVVKGTDGTEADLKGRRLLMKADQADGGVMPAAVKGVPALNILRLLLGALQYR